MMGYSHTVSAAAGWLVLVETGVVQVPDTPTLIVTTLACAGAGMLPDIDHHNGSIANSIPPISRWVARIVWAVSGGHRKGTHSILGLVAFWAVAYFSANLSYNGIPWASLLLAAFSGGLACACSAHRVDGSVPSPSGTPPTRLIRWHYSPGPFRSARPFT